MQVYTYSEARQKLAFVLEQAEDTGKVLEEKTVGLSHWFRKEMFLRRWMFHRLKRKLQHKK